MDAVKKKNVKVSELNLNKGQVKGLPKNPRFIRDPRFEALKQSIADAPEMLDLREVVAYDNDGELVVIMGNMRLQACKDLGYKEVPCKILPKSTPVAKLREYTIKDNVEFGENDMEILANEWNMEELADWGMEDIQWGEAASDVDIDSFLNDVPANEEKESMQMVKISFAANVELAEVKQKIKEALEGYIYSIK